jgi:erythronate-4-phosphate dehydrogenase
MIKVLADQYLYNLQSHIPENVNLQTYDPSDGLPQQLEGVNALLVRTTNTLDEDTLPNLPSSLSFVATASAGSDHVDTAYLQQNGIHFTNAAGCNARSVAEYVGTALLLWQDKKNFELDDLTVGIVGVGHVGTQVQYLLEELDISYVSYDPPRGRRDHTFNSASKEEVLGCDIITFHTPLTHSGDNPTYHWLKEEKLAKYTFKLVINTSRGGVIDEQSLREAIDSQNIGDIIIDTWEHEPIIQLDTAEKAFIATPHIAGYSEQAKDNATKIVVQAMLDHFGISNENIDGTGEGRTLTDAISQNTSLTDLISKLHPINDYQRELRKIIKHHPSDRGRRFNKLRAEYPLRQEFAQTYIPKSYIRAFPILQNLGFSIINDKKSE